MGMPSVAHPPSFPQRPPLLQTPGRGNALLSFRQISLTFLSSFSDGIIRPILSFPMGPKVRVWFKSYSNVSTRRTNPLSSFSPCSTDLRAPLPIIAFLFSLLLIPGSLASCSATTRLRIDRKWPWALSLDWEVNGVLNVPSAPCPHLQTTYLAIVSRGKEQLGSTERTRVPQWMSVGNVNVWRRLCSSSGSLIPSQRDLAHRSRYRCSSGWTYTSKRGQS